MNFSSMGLVRAGKVGTADIVDMAGYPRIAQVRDPGCLLQGRRRFPLCKRQKLTVGTAHIKMPMEGCLHRITREYVPGN